VIAPKRTFLGLLGKIIIVASALVAFLFGMFGTIYLSLRSPEVQVPNLVGQARAEGETELQKIGLNIRKRAERPSADAKPDTIIDQSPRAGEMIKVGQTVAVIVARPPKEGETPIVTTAPSPENRNANETARAENRSPDNSNEANRNRNSANRNSNARNTNNRNANNRNANGNNTNNLNRNPNANARNLNTNVNRNLNTNVNRNQNANRNTNNANTNRRPPVIATPPANANRRP